MRPLRELSALGVGLKILPHPTRELVELGFADELAVTGIPTEELIPHDRFGSRICGEPRGLAAGYRWPPYSIHRGELQMMLLTPCGIALVLTRSGPGWP